MGDKKGRILFVDDEKLDRMLFERFAAQEDFPYDYVIAESVSEAYRILKSESFDAVVTDYFFGDGTAGELFNNIKDIPFIIISGAGSEAIVASAMKGGVYDYLVKDSQGDYLKLLSITIAEAIGKKRTEDQAKKYHDQLEIRVKERTAKLENEINERKKAEDALRNALAEVEQLKNRLQAENVYLQDEIKLEYNFEEIIGHSEGYKKILREIEQVAATNTTALILGETGTGKELIARAIHNISARRDRPLVKVDCAALPVNLIESALFGHEKGAFTGARVRKIGRFELADKGTVFLDEIGDLPFELQTKLLRVLQEGEFERLGGTTIKVDVRIIAATNRDLEEAVQAGTFRRDLYYRLNVFPIKAPPLRERKDDIPLLVNYFVQKYSTKAGKEIKSLPLKVMSNMQAYYWPGNVRELENVIERAVVLTSDSILQLDELLDSPSQISARRGQKATLEENERSFIIKILQESNWVIQGNHGAARRLGVAPSTLRSRMKKLGVQRPPLAP